MTTADAISARAMDIVDDVLASTAERNERGVAQGRIFVCGAFLARIVVLFGSDMIAGSIRDVVDAGNMMLGIVGSLALLRTRRAVIAGLDRRTVSVLLDVVVFGAALLTLTLLPDAHYEGVLRAQVTAAGVLVPAAAGLRLERRFVVIATCGVVAVVGTGCVVDLLLWRHVMHWGVASVVFFSILFAGSGVLGDIIARRTHDIALDAARQAFEAERARDRFGAYVGPEVAALALASRDVVMGGRRQPVAVLFCDLRGFTTSSEQQQPEEVVRQLNAYFEVMVAVIHAHGGVVDKYVGDAIMAVFGAPTARPDDARRAVKAGLAMQHALRLHNARRHMDGLGPLRIGVGVHYGDVVAGNIGTARHAQYTVVGDVVNLASRLENATRDHGVGALFSKDVVDAAHAAAAGDGTIAPLPLVARGSITVKGRAQAVVVFAPDEPVVGPFDEASNPLLLSSRRA